MTNAQLVQEINRMIRGIALNYPSGLPEIRRQLEALEPTVRRGPEDTVSVGKGPLHSDVSERWQPTATQAAPIATLSVIPERRKPGRPKGSKNRPTGDAA